MSSQNKPIRDQINTVSANLESGPPPQYEHFIKARINPNGNSATINLRSNISFILNYVTDSIRCTAANIRIFVFEI